MKKVQSYSLTNKQKKLSSLLFLQGVLDDSNVQSNATLEKEIIQTGCNDNDYGLKDLLRFSVYELAGNLYYKGYTEKLFTYLHSKYQLQLSGAEQQNIKKTLKKQYKLV